MAEDDARRDGRDATIAADLALGSEFAGYRIHSLIARGASSSVYFADDLRMKRKVALKVLAPELEHREAFRERFLRESQLAGSLRHGNVIPIYEAGASGGLLYVAMRHIDGTDLRRLLQKGPLTPARAYALTAQVAAALDAAHARGLVHRDVKPSNVLVDQSGHAFLADFGMTRRLRGAGGAEDGVQGTVDYVAPEQIHGHDVDGRADLYSLGCVLHECVVGRPPFVHDSVFATLFDHMTTPPPRPRGLERVIPKALAKDPAERFASGRELADAARQALGLTRPSRLRWSLEAAAAAIVLVALVALLFMTYGGSGTPEVAQDALVRLDPASGKVLDRVRVGTQLTGVATTRGAVWAADPNGGALIRLKTPAYEPRALPARGSPNAVAAGRRFVLAANGDNGTVAVFDASTGRLHTTAQVTGNGARAVCDVALEGSIGWAADCLHHRIVKFAADSGEVLLRIPLPPFADDETTIDRLFAGIAVGPDALWVAGDALDPTLYRLDRASGLLEAVIPVPAGTVGVVTGAGSVWLANQLDDSVIRIDTDINAVADRIAVGREPLSIAFSAGFVWTANALDGTVTRIDPSGRGKAETLSVGRRPVAIGAGPGGVWVATSR